MLAKGQRSTNSLPALCVEEMQMLGIELQRNRAADLRQILRYDARHEVVRPRAGIDEHLVADGLDEIEGELRRRAVAADADVFGADAQDQRAGPGSLRQRNGHRVV